VSRWFGLLVIAQAAHSTEEYVGRLYDVFPPARAVSGLFGADLARGFVVFNALLVAFGVVCYFGPIRRVWRSATFVAWLWICIELVNGIGHPLWSIVVWGYTPGVVSALAILPLVIGLLVSTSRTTRP
jgi:hypothetical protein